MMIAKTCDGEKGKDIKTFCDKGQNSVMMLIYHRRLVHSCHKLIYYCSYIIVTTKNGNIYLGDLDLSNDI